MVGAVTMPLEIRELGKKMALLRNGMSYLIAVLVAFLMGVSVETLTALSARKPTGGNHAGV